MSRIDPSLIDPSILTKFPQIDRQQQDLQIAQKQAVIAEQRAATQDRLTQAQLRTQQANELAQKMQEQRRAYNAKQAVQGYLGTHRGAAYGQPELDMQEMLSVGGPDAIPFVKDFLDQNKEAIAQRKDQNTNENEIAQAYIDAYSLDDDPSHHREIEENVTRDLLQRGKIDQARANMTLANPPDKIHELKAHQVVLKRQADQLAEAEKTNLAHNQALDAAAKTTLTEADVKRKQLENARLEQGLPPVPVAEKPETPHTVETGAGVMQWNPKTERYDIKVGPPKSTAEGDAPQLTPGAIDNAARLYHDTGVAPSTGMGKAGIALKSKIMNREAELYGQDSLALNKATFQADEGSLKALQKNRDAVVAFEATASKNLDQFLNTAQKIVDTGSPWINKPLRTIDQRALGSADLLAFNAARQVAVNEIAKVTGNPGLSGQLSDSARHEVEQFIPADATLAQIVSVAKILKQDMKNRHDTLDEQIGAIQKRIGGGGKGGGTETAASDMIDVETGGKTGKIHASQWAAFKAKYHDAKKK